MKEQLWKDLQEFSRTKSRESFVKVTKHRGYSYLDPDSKRHVLYLLELASTVRNMW